MVIKKVQQQQGNGNQGPTLIEAPTAPGMEDVNDGAGASGPSITLGPGSTVTQGTSGPMVTPVELPTVPTYTPVEPLPGPPAPSWSPAGSASSGGPTAEPLPPGLGGIDAELDALLGGGAAPPPAPGEFVLEPDDQGVWTEVPYERAEQPHVRPPHARRTWIWWGLGAASLTLAVAYYMMRRPRRRR